MVTTTDGQPAPPSARAKVLRPQDADCDGPQQAWNAMVDRRPALTHQCRDTSELMAALARDGGASI